MTLSRRFLPLIITILLTIPGLSLRIYHPELHPVIIALITGTAIFGAAFMLMWACDVAQLDIPQTLALAIVAFIAVLPEYAVDMYFTWMAGKDPTSPYVHYAIANMTGANRLLIGVGWSLIALLFFWRFRKEVILNDERCLEIKFLGMATLYAFVIPLKGALTWVDAVVLITIYAVYIYFASRRPCAEDVEHEGMAAALASLPQKKRRWTTLSMFLYAAVVIVADAEFFSESLVASGKLLGINEFLLVQWLAPIASEAPEFIVAIMFALRGLANMSLGALLSSKLNQWTLLVGMIPLVFALSFGSFASPMPMDSHQMHEILLTAAQSLFALCLIINMRLTVRDAFLLLLVFMAQFASPLYEGALENMLGLEHTPDRMLLFYSYVYFALSGYFIVRHWKNFIALFSKKCSV